MTPTSPTLTADVPSTHGLTLTLPRHLVVSVLSHLGECAELTAAVDDAMHAARSDDEASDLAAHYAERVDDLTSDADYLFEQIALLVEHAHASVAYPASG